MLRALFCLLCLGAASAQAHSLWVEPAKGGFKVFYGEPGEEAPDSGDKLDPFSTLEAWDANGSTLSAQREKDHYFFATDSKALTVRSLKGLYYGDGKDGALYVQYARTGAVSSRGGRLFLDLAPVTGSKKDFQVLKDGQPLASAELTLHAPGGWSRPMKSDERGQVRLEFPWKGRYILSGYWEEKRMGARGKEAYSKVGHMSSLCFYRP